MKITSNTEQYWRDRYSLDKTLGERTEEEMLKHLKGLYANATAEINKEIEAFYGRYAVDNNLTLTEVKKRLNAEELTSSRREIARYYSEVDRLARGADGKVSVDMLKKYKERLRLQSARAYVSRLEDLKRKINHNLVKLGLNESEVMHDSMLKAGENAYAKSSDELSRYMGFNNSFSDNQFERIVDERWLGANYSDRVWKNKEQLENELEKTLLQGVVRGQNPKKIAKEMQRNMGGAYYRCERLARTEMLHTLNESTMRSYKDYGVEEYKFVCGPDERTCPECSALEGRVFKIKDAIEGVNYPVIHPNCRCATAPFFENEID